MTTTKRNIACCTMRGHRVGIKVYGLAPSHRYEVGVDGWLVGNYDNHDQAIEAAREQVRMLDGGVMLAPAVSPRFRDAVRLLSIDG